jgi:UDP-N-acetylmuramoyl-tripeptide--D-alanyl-D-alanine ligase
VIEIGVNGPGQMARPARLLGPDVVVVTSIGSEHNRSFGAVEATREEKLEMVRALRAGGVAILNGDDPNVRWMAGQTNARVITFGFGPENDVRGRELELDWPRGTRFTLETGDELRSVRTQLLGWPMVYSALAAIAVAISEGIPLDNALARLEALAPTPGRLEPVALENGAFVLRDDFKSTLESIDAALDVMSEIPARRKIIVLGDVSEPPGSQGPIYWRIGERVATIADQLVVVGDGFQRYRAGVRRAGFPSEAVVNAKHDVLGVAAIVLADLGEGDVVLVKGRDTQKLDRVSLALAGRRVRCALSFCDLRMTRCANCPLLERDGSLAAP